MLLRAGQVFTGAGKEIENGWLLARDGLITEVGSGPPPAADEVLHLPNCLAVPGLVNAHDHMYQWATRGYVPDGGLFEWLRALYPVWARIDADTVRLAARAAMARLLLSGCTLSTDHHYVFPRGRDGHLRGAGRDRERAGPALPSLSWIDVPRRVARAACLRTAWSKTRTRSSRTRRKRSTTSTTRRPGRCAAWWWRRARRSR